jgi:hypothetical protein
MRLNIRQRTVMKASSRPSAFEFTLIAEIGERFCDFAPYVPSVNDAGVVAFQAALPSGGSGVFTGEGQDVDALNLESVNERGQIAVRVSLDDGRQAILRSDTLT